MSFFEVVFILSFIMCIIVAITFWAEYKQYSNRYSLIVSRY
jgi:hypothetical protein